MNNGNPDNKGHLIARARRIYIGTAAWAIPKEYRAVFSAQPEDDPRSQLARYSGLLNAVEINSSFYRDHRPATYERWRDSVPEGFLFSVKLSREFTHVQRLRKGEKSLHETLAAVRGLGNRLGPLLVQLPPGLKFASADAAGFFAELRDEYGGAVVLEPRHMSWNAPAALDLQRQFGLSRVQADPEPYPGANILPAEDVIYHRLHGSPEIYRSLYTAERISHCARRLRETAGTGRQAWCIFDNTTYGHATMNALELTRLMSQPAPPGQKSPSHGDQTRL